MNSRSILKVYLNPVLFQSKIGDMNGSEQYVKSVKE